MRLQPKPQRWMCLPASFAMALDIPLADVLRDVGHDGGSIVWPNLPEPICRRGFHPQELIDICLSRGYAVTRIELAPAMATVPNGPELRLFTDKCAWQRFVQVIRTSLGVIEGRLPSLGSRGRLRPRPHLRSRRARVRLLARSLRATRVLHPTPLAR